MLKNEFFARKHCFFIDQPDEIANYVKTYCEEEVRKIIEIADDVCNQSYLFNLRWDMERTYEPVVFDGEIDWMHMPADDPEWIYAFNRHRFFICLGQAYVMTKDEKYAKIFVHQLCNWIDRVKRKDEKCKLAWRTIEAGLRLEYWLKAFCYFENSTHLTEEVCSKFFDAITDHAEYLMEVYDTFRLMSNWGILQNHGLFMAGVFLPQSKRTKEYVQTAIERLTEEIKIQVYRDGTHWEQSPMYHNEVNHCYLDILILAQRNNIILPDLILEKVKAMCEVNLYWKKPNHHEIMQGDSDDIDVRDIITKGAYLFKDPILKFGGYGTFDFDCIWDLGMKAVEEYKTILAEMPKDTAHALLDSGNIYMRSDWSENAYFMHFHCGTLGAGHGHSDKLHIDLFANGEDILIDAGRYTYVDKPERYLFKDPAAHNTITVDGLDFTVCKDPWECSKLAQAANQRHYFDKAYDYAEGGHLGYMSLVGGGVFVNRKIIYIKPDIYVLVDEFYASTEHKYQQYFHFNNAGTVSCKENVIYTSEKNRAELVFATPGIEKQLRASQVSRHYNHYEENLALVTQIEGKGFKSVISVIGISNPLVPEEIQVEKLEVKSNFKHITFADDVIEAVTIHKGDQAYTVVVAHQEYASPTDTFYADGCIGFGQVVVFDRTQGEERIGTVLKW
ncbi:alginate lyase family protein [Cellulosilyticum sp. I15G10I2]|uniref:alginate lyase family protein n=1 Tax=Cellulosilyticum sp. I15G10I2 TaxID=1892843 RepID=UPI00085C04C6|nr:alginate lyase family protein [Cellulosilyticum sp. I15G10I2]